VVHRRPRGLVGGVKTRESGGCDNPDEATCEKRCEGSDSAFPSWFLGPRHHHFSHQTPKEGWERGWVCEPSAFIALNPRPPPPSPFAHACVTYSREQPRMSPTHLGGVIVIVGCGRRMTLSPFVLHLRNPRAW